MCLGWGENKVESIMTHKNDEFYLLGHKLFDFKLILPFLLCAENPMA
jgi:hypothetical protein